VTLFFECGADISAFSFCHCIMVRRLFPQTFYWLGYACRFCLPIGTVHPGCDDSPPNLEAGLLFSKGLEPLSRLPASMLSIPMCSTVEKEVAL